MSVVRVDATDDVAAGLSDGSFDVVAATYPPRVKWIEQLRACAVAGPCIWLAEGGEVSAAYASAFGDDERAVSAHAVLDLSDPAEAALPRACLSADYVYRIQRGLQEALTERESNLDEAMLAQFVIENSSVVVFRWAPAAGSPVRYVSDNISIFGYSSEELMSGDFFYQGIVHPEDLELNLRRMKEYTEAGIDRFLSTYRILTKDGEERWIEDDTTVVRDERGRVLYHQGIVIDVTQRRAAQDQLVRLSQAVEQSPGSVVIADTRGRIEYVNQAFTDVSGFEWDEVVDKELIGFNSDGESTESKALWKAIWQGQEWQGQVRKRRADGAIYWEAVKGSPVRGAEGRITHYLEVGEDITARMKNEAIVRQMAYYDALTGLPNRTLYYDRLAQALTHARRDNGIVGVLFLDLDGFKQINDTLGHAAGDSLLRQVGQRIRGAVRDGDTVGRLGGDEFIVACRDLESAGDIETVARKIVDAFQEPYWIDGNERTVTTSVGAATFPRDGGDPETLIRAADAAMYQAKQSGRNTWCATPGSDTSSSVRSLAMHEMLSQAIVREEFGLRFHPVINAETGEVVAADTHLRWMQPGRGVLKPAEFMALAERAGIRQHIDRWVIHRVCEAWKELDAAGLGHIRLSIDATDRRLSDSEFRVDAIEAMRLAGIPSGRLEVDVDIAHAVRTDTSTAELRALREAGLRVGVTQLGASPWPLGALNDLPFDALKFERELVRTLPDHPRDAALARAYALVAASLGAELVARGVEGGAQLSLVSDIGCTIVQGFAYALPMELGDFIGFASRREAEEPQALAEAVLEATESTPGPRDSRF